MKFASFVKPRAVSYSETYTFEDGSVETHYILKYDFLSSLLHGVSTVETTNKDSFLKMVFDEESRGIHVKSQVPLLERLTEKVEYTPVEGGSGRFKARVERNPF